MKPLTKEWVIKAEGDWAVAQREWRIKNPVYDVVCFLCQQCIEKYLKALIQESGLFPAKTHDLGSLIGKIQNPAKLVLFKEELKKISAYAVSARYPGETATRADAKMCIAVAKNIRNIARNFFGVKNP